MADPQTETMTFDASAAETIDDIENLFLMAIFVSGGWDESEDLTLAGKIRKDQATSGLFYNITGQIKFTGGDYAVDNTNGAVLILDPPLGPLTELTIGSSGAQTATVRPRFSRLLAL